MTNGSIQSGIIIKLVGHGYYGFIQPVDDPGEGIFFHGSALVDSPAFEQLREGQPVQFRTQMYRGRSRAYGVEVTKDRPRVNLTGKIFRLVPIAQFGFIQPDEDGQDVYFHKLGVTDPGDYESLKEGERVAFSLTTDRQGRYLAIGVTRE